MALGKKERASKDSPLHGKRNRGENTPKETSSQEREKERKTPFPIVGIGSSAGGLEATETFFDAMPGEPPNMAFILISHLDPSHESLLPELLQKHTRMEVLQIKDDMGVQPHRVYVIPPDRDVRLENGKLRLTQAHRSSEPRAPINQFFRSLAEELGEMAIGIILSGMGSDGTIGIQAIKGELGMVMVQDPDSAKYNSMPQSAINTGLADFVLPPGEMPEQLIEYADRLLKAGHLPAEKMPSQALNKICTIIRASTGHDFSHYKESTVQRRISRRINIHGMRNPSEYVRHLQKNPKEVLSLVKELLIGVTRFFRDGEAFEALKKSALSKLLEGKTEGYTLRAWVAGCATGEEAYSLAIILREYIEEHQLNTVDVQVFATDLDEDAIARAREGIFSADIAADVSPERLRKFFRKQDHGYRVSTKIRETIVFAHQSLIKDPPFTKLDLICCRNLLIYLDIDLQKKLVPLFHYSLKADGILFLGTSETIGQFTDLFSVLDVQWKIFQRKAGSQYHLLPMDFQHTPPAHGKETAPIRKTADLTTLAERTLLDRHTPPAMIIDSKGDIRYIHGRVQRYLEHAQGQIRSYNAFEMAREGLKIQLISMMRNMRPDSDSVKREVRIEQNGNTIDVQVTVTPMPKEEASGLYVVLFGEASGETKKDRKQTVKPIRKGGGAARIQKLEEEVQVNKEKLRTAVEELESANEELRSANEEYQSTNEELQSANEELNSSKEELQSLNEELETVNTELQGKVRQVERAYDEMSKMLNSLDMPTIFLDGNLRIRRFSSNAERIVELIETDLGRPLKQLSSKVLEVDLEKEARQVLDAMRYVEKEVETEEGRWYLMRILPYPGVENQRSGVALTFVDIKELKEMSERLKSAEESWRFAQGIVETVREPLLVLDRNLNVISGNESFYSVFHVSEKEVEGRSIFDLGERDWEIPELRKLLEEVLPKRQSFDDFEIEHVFPRIGRKKMRLNARRIYERTVGIDRILLAIEDVTGKE
jgi:two-component system CheB/CheR fusion protein